MWRYRIVKLLRQQYKSGNLTLPSALSHIKNEHSFNAWLNMHYQKKWVVHLAKPDSNHKKNVEYLGKYLKRPPIGETRLKNYDGENVTYEFLNHHDNTHQTKTLPVQEFIARLIRHIPDRYFRAIRYYGWLSNRTRGTLLPVVKTLLKTKTSVKNTTIEWRILYMQTFGTDPLECPDCHQVMRLSSIIFPTPIFDLLLNHKAIAQDKCV